MAFAALTIDINAKLANLEAGLGRAESQLAGFAKKAESAAAGIAAGFGAIAGGLAVSAVLDRFAAAVTELSALDDAADQTGSSVEELSSLLNTLSPYGATLDQITDATGKLARAMAGADDETKGAGAAFAALGIATRDASGNLRPTVDVLTDVAQALDQYEDGTNKTVLVQQLFGNEKTRFFGASILAFSISSDEISYAKTILAFWAKILLPIPLPQAQSATILFSTNGLTKSKRAKCSCFTQGGIKPSRLIRSFSTSFMKDILDDLF